MNVNFSKPATYSGVKRIQVRAMVKWDFETKVLELVHNDKGWDVIRPAESSIWKSDGTVIRPAQPVKYFAINLPLAIAKQTAKGLIETGLYTS